MPVDHYPPSPLGPTQVNGTVTATGRVRASQFRATQDGSAAEYAYTWDVDPNIGLRREPLATEQFILGVGNNQPVAIQQFAVWVNETMVGNGGFIMQAFLTPPTISGVVHDYNPPAWNASRAGIYQDLSGLATLTGLAFTTNGSAMRFTNASAVAGRTLTLQHDNGVDSTAANRFWCPNLVNYVLAPGEVVWLQYDGNISRWRVCGSA